MAKVQQTNVVYRPTTQEILQEENYRIPGWNKATRQARRIHRTNINRQTPRKGHCRHPDGLRQGEHYFAGAGSAPGNLLTTSTGEYRPHSNYRVRPEIYSSPPPASTAPTVITESPWAAIDTLDLATVEKGLPQS